MSEKEKREDQEVEKSHPVLSVLKLGAAILLILICCHVALGLVQHGIGLVLGLGSALGLISLVR